jgi:prepilin-type N-terminal cleavage/methylation domain-containing protein
MKPVTPMPLPAGAPHHGFTFTELLVTLSLLGVLAAVWISGHRWLKTRAGVAVSTAHLHALVGANAAYALDHDGAYCPATSADNLTRWHGGRRRLDEDFDPQHGFLAPYLGGHRLSLSCPLLRDLSPRSFEKGSGGYGYNAQYLGGTPQNPFAGAVIGESAEAGRVIMFATTALAVAGGIQEYPFTEPYEWIDHRGRLRGPLQPSTHFRAGGKALVAWSDGSVTAESPNEEIGPNFYGGDNLAACIGWFGPRELNGCWNPNSPASRGIRTSPP